MQGISKLAHDLEESDEYLKSTVHNRNAWTDGLSDAAPDFLNDGFDSKSAIKALPPPILLDFGEMMTRTFPERERLLSPWLLSQSVNMIYAMRGVGKTHVALGVAHALSTGSEFLGWKAEKPVRVLYLDGEMPGTDLQKRIRAIASSTGISPNPGFMGYVNIEAQPNFVMPNLNEDEGRSRINNLALDYDVVIVDNISCLVRGGKENESDSWQPVQEWAMALRASGKTVIFIHHSGKGGNQRGTSSREDIMDIVICLSRPDDYEANEGARFEVHFTKGRHVYGDDADPVEASLVTDASGKQTWETRNLQGDKEAKFVELYKDQVSENAICEILSIKRSKYYQMKKAAITDGRIKPRPRKAKNDDVTSNVVGFKSKQASAYRNKGEANS